MTTTTHTIEVDLSAGVRARYDYDSFATAIDRGHQWVRDALRSTLPGCWSEVMIDWYVYRVENHGGTITLEWYAVGRGDERVTINPDTF